MKDKDNEIREVVERISSNDIKPYESSLPEQSDELYLECKSTSHDSESVIREGNKLFAVLVKERDDRWHLEDYTCWKCSVKNIVEKNHDRAVAVVETTLRIGSNYKEMYFEDAEVKDLMKKQT